jgi:DNA-binding YbaB/EbfC family protein
LIRDINFVPMLGLGKLKEAKEKAQQMKAKLASMSFEGEAASGLVKATCNGEKVFSSIDINDSIFKVRSREEVQGLILEAVNNAQLKADATIKQEMSAIMPNIPGLGLDF